jgi:putative (di)nucleoside polyphosphate hydrolase
MLLNKQRHVWIGRRFEKQNDDGVGKWWQMPQGGIDEGEDAGLAAMRELQEETAVTSVRIIAEAPGWFTYDLPAHLIGKSWKGKYRGQKQKWFALEFLGQDSEINLTPPGHKQEFDEWRWAKMDEMIDLIIPFKREVYVDVIAAFRHLAA